MFLRGKKLFLTAVIGICFNYSFAQTTSGSSFNLDKVNTITTAVPFLRIVNDTRSGGMGDVGIAMSADANGAQLNGAKMGFVDKKFGFGLSFSPWLKSLVNDIYLANLTGYGKIGENNVIHGGLRYFSLGSIQFTNDQGENIGQDRPQELALDLGYARKLHRDFSVGVTLRFIYSRLANGTYNGTQIKPGIAGAGDISFLYHRLIEPKKGKMTHEVYAGACFSNLGSKITYTNSVVKDFIPANMGLGIGYNLNIDAKNTIGVYCDVNKLLVPSPVHNEDLYELNTATPDPYDKKIKAQYDKNTNGIADFREVSSVKGIFQSFNDAPGGSAEEIREVMVGAGLEYMYKKMFGVRCGYFYEHPTKGNRQFFTVGATVKYSVAGLHLSYLVPTSNIRNPLDNTFRLSLTFEFSKGGAKKKDAQSIENTPAAVNTSAPPPNERRKTLNKKSDVEPIQGEPKKE